MIEAKRSRKYWTMARSLGAEGDIFGDEFSVTFSGKTHAMACYGMY